VRGVVVGCYSAVDTSYLVASARWMLGGFTMCVLCSTGGSGGRGAMLMDSARGWAERAVDRRRRLVGQGSAMRQNRPVVFEPSWVLACDEHDVLHLLRDHSVVVDGNRIVEISAGRRRGRERRISAPGALLLPGLISGHTHVAAGTATRGIIEGGRTYGRPLQLADSLDSEDLEALTAHNLAELLRGGCTTQVEMSMSLRQVDAYVRVASRWGVRGYPSAMVPGIGRLFDIWGRTTDQVLFDSVSGTLEEITAALRFGRECNGGDDGRILPQMGVHATDTHTPETMQALAVAAQELGNGLHMHLSQSSAETETVQRLWGKRPVEWIDEFGFYDGPLFAAHMTGADLDADPDILRANNATYVHNPSAGGAGGGTQPWPEFLAAGVRTNIGIDTHSNDHLENVKLAVLYGQARHSLLADSSTRPLARPTIWDAIRAATLNGAIGLGRDDLGRIRVGAKADLITVDVVGMHTGSGAPPPEPLNNLLYSNGQHVCHVMVDGRFQIHNGHLVVDDEHQIIRRGGEAVVKIWDQLQAEQWFEA
jgi:5-methylthioadenosine/S-adenosylhomocysteine deaminase